MYLAIQIQWVNLDFSQGSGDEDTAASFGYYSDAIGFNDILTINGNGGVGINKILPNAKLDIDGDAIVSGNLTVTNNISASSLVVSGGAALFYETAQIGDNAYLLFNSGIDKLVAFPGLYVTGAITASTALSASNIGATTAVFSEVTASSIFFSASNSSYWFGSPPSTLQEALNRIAEAIYNGITGTIAWFLIYLQQRINKNVNRFYEFTQTGYR